ncbi:MAG: HIT family protein [Methanotrichaceae archaeon]|nr:HIT family protein [Methanotrichaceae archaeon]
MGEDCIFCKIVEGTEKAHVIYEDDLCMAILDINPFAMGHALVIPKRHVPWWHDLSEEEVEAVFKGAQKVAGKIKRAFSPDFVALYIRGRRIPHTHVFLVPTYSRDPLDRFFNALEGFQEGAGMMADLCEPDALEEALRRLEAA